MDKTYIIPIPQKQQSWARKLSRFFPLLPINPGADAAAGLTISEKMKGQMNGLAQAQRNAQDAISMNQIAEGVLKESHSILQRMRELAVQSSNDTNAAGDRAPGIHLLEMKFLQLWMMVQEVDGSGQSVTSGSTLVTRF